jgi:hypothetical protein
MFGAKRCALCPEHHAETEKPHEQSNRLALQGDSLSQRITLSGIAASYVKINLAWKNESTPAC